MFCVLLLLAGCNSVLNPIAWERVIGVTEIGGSQPPPIQLPEVIRSGESFPATVVTYGSGSCTRADGAEVQRTPQGLDITPYDLRATGNVNCTDDLAVRSRTVSLRLEGPGEAVIRVIGRRLVTNATTVYDTTVTVTP
ncbi:hypothetical protein BH23GEM6_BH23GEM6_18780 [soil metagenome]